MNEGRILILGGTGSRPQDVAHATQAAAQHGYTVHLFQLRLDTPFTFDALTGGSFLVTGWDMMDVLRWWAVLQSLCPADCPLLELKAYAVYNHGAYKVLIVK